MAVSSTTTWSMTFDEIIDEAQQRVGGELSTGYDARRAMRALNLLQQEFSLRGINLWKLEERFQTLTIDVARATLDSDVIDIVKDTALIRDISIVPYYDMTIARIAVDEYENLPDKAASGKPVQFWLDRQRDAPVAVFWPVPDTATYQFRYTAMVKFFDAARMRDNMDVPDRWLPSVVSGLAWMLASGLPSIDEAKLTALERRYDRDYAIAAKEDRDTSGLRVLPDLGVYARCPF